MFMVLHVHPSIFTPRSCARGKVIGRVVVVIVVVVVVISRKIAISRGLGTSATGKHNALVKLDEKRTSVRGVARIYRKWG